jgi:hypothetical protein
LKLEDYPETLDGFCSAIKTIITTADMDWVHVNIGTERGGKSTLGFRMCYAIDKEFSLNQIIYSSEDFKKVLDLITEKNKAVMIDEGALAVFARDSIKTENKNLIQAMTVLGHRNAFICINITSMRLLDVYLRLERLRSLARVVLYFEPDSIIPKRGKMLFYSKHDAGKITKDGYGRFIFPKRPTAVFNCDKITDQDEPKLWALWQEYEKVSKQVKLEAEKGHKKSNFNNILNEFRGNPDKFYDKDNTISETKLIEQGLDFKAARNIKKLLEKENLRGYLDV